MRRVILFLLLSAVGASAQFYVPPVGWRQFMKTNEAGAYSTNAWTAPEGLITNNSSGVTLTGTFTGNGAYITNLDGANIQSGTIKTNQVDQGFRDLLGGSGGDVYTASDNVFAGSNTFTGPLLVISTNSTTILSNLYAPTGVIQTFHSTNASFGGVIFSGMMTNSTGTFDFRSINGSRILEVGISGLSLGSGTGAALYWTTASGTVPTLTPYRGESGSGIGRVAANSPAIVASSVTRYAPNGVAKALTDETAVGLFSLTGRTNCFAGGELNYTIYCRDAGLESQAVSGVVSFAAVNTNGVWTTPVLTEAAQSKCVTSGTIASTWSAGAAASGGTTNLTISVSCDTSLTPAAGQFYILWQVHQNSTNGVSVL